MTQLFFQLKQNFDSAKAGDLDATIEFRWPEGQCLVGIHDGTAHYYSGGEITVNTPAPDLIIYFRDEAQALDIINGRDHPIEAFMRGALRSNGHIVWVFQILAAFSGELQPPALPGADGE